MTINILQGFDILSLVWHFFFEIRPRTVTLITQLTDIVKPDPNENYPKKVARHSRVMF